MNRAKSVSHATYGVNGRDKAQSSTRDEGEAIANVLMEPFQTEFLRRKFPWLASIRHRSMSLSLSKPAVNPLYLDAMNTFVLILLLLAMAATVGALVWGVIAMARGGDFNAKWSNKMMRYRILFQFIAICVFMALLSMLGKG